MRRSSLLVFFVLGFFSLLAQTVVIREFIISFGGNELGIGLFYFSWLFWVGLGALAAAGRFGGVSVKNFLRLLFLYPVLAVGEVFLFILLRPIAGVSGWEFFSLQKAVFYIFIFSALFSFFTGFLFTLGAVWARKISGININGADSPGDSTRLIARVYAYEALGSFCAGIAVTFLIINLVPPLTILFGAGAIFSSAVLIVASRLKDKFAAGLQAVLLAVLLVGCAMGSRLADFQQYARVSMLMPRAKILETVYTPYQHLVVSQLPGQKIILSDGEVISGIPEYADADRESALLFSQAYFPSRVLLIGTAAENLIHSLLKFPLEQITYCVQDKDYYQQVYAALPVDWQKEFSSSRVKVVFSSGRAFAGAVNEKFDLVVVCAPDPSSLWANSLFTREFYSAVAGILSDKGILATRIRGGENFLGKESADYGSSVYYTLKKVFPELVIVPGDNVWFFAGRDNSGITEDAAVLGGRLEKVRPENFSFSGQNFSVLLNSGRVGFARKAYRDNPFFKNSGLINTDADPLVFFLNLLVLASYDALLPADFFKNAILTRGLIFFIPLVMFFFFRAGFLKKSAQPQ